MNAYLSRFIADDFLTACDEQHRDMTVAINSPKTGESTSEALTEIQSSIEDRMVAVRAVTVEGMRAKAQTLRRLMADGDDSATICPDDADDIGRMTWSLLTDVLGEKSGAVELPAMPLKQMFALYDILRATHDILLGFAGNHRCQSEDGGYNLAGDVVDDLVTLMGCLSDRIAEDAEAVRPSDDLDVAMRAEIMMRHEISSEGPSSAATLAAEIYGKPAEAA